MEIREVIRRWQAGLSQRRIASGTGLSRVTVRRYIAAAEAAGLRPGGPEPSEQQLAQLATLSRTGPRRAEVPSEQLLSPWAEQIEGWLTAERLQVTRVQELLAERGCEVSYSSLRRFIQRRGWRQRQPVTVRMEDGPPGEVAELDFGRLGLISGPRERAAAHGVGADRGLALLAALLRLAHHQPDAARGGRGPGGGLGVLRGRAPLPRHRQLPGRRGRGRRAAPALHAGLPRVRPPARLHHRPRTRAPAPRQAPGRAQRPVRARAPLQGRAVPGPRRAARRRPALVPRGGRAAHPRDDPANARSRSSEDEERPLLAPWDGEPYEVPDWRTAKVHADHHVACQYALYSVPSELCPPGQQVEVQLGAKLVRIYHRGALLKVHPRQPRGGRATDRNDYPAELSPYTLRAPEQLQRRAAELGEAVGALAERLFEGPLPWAKLRQGHKLLRLAERYSPARLDAACLRALEVDLIDVRRVERILVEAIDQETTPPQQPLPPPPGRFARPGAVFALTATQTTTGASR